MDIEKVNGTKFANVLPSKCVIAPELIRQRETEGVDADLKSSIESFGVIKPLLVYVEGPVINVVDGSRRLVASQAIEAEGTEIKIPVMVIPKGPLAQMLAYKVIANDSRYVKEDNYQTRVDTFKLFAAEGWTPAQIGELTGFSHTLVNQYLKIQSVKPLVDAIEKGKIKPETAAHYVTNEYLKVDKDNKKTKQFDEKKIKDQLAEDMKQAAATGSTLLRPKHQKARKAGDGKKKQTTLGTQWLKAIYDAPAGTVPLPVVNLLAAFFYKKTVEQAIADSGKGLNFLEKVDFRSSKEKKAAKTAAAKANAEKSKKAEALIDDDDESEIDE